MATFNISGGTVAEYRIQQGENTAQASASATAASASAQLAANTVANVQDQLAQAVPWLAIIESGAGGYFVPVLDFAPSLGRVWLNGRLRTLADVATDHGDGSYTFTEIPQGLANGITVYFEYDDAGHTGTPSGQYFAALANTATLGSEIGATAQRQAGGSTVLGYGSVNRAAATVEQLRFSRFGSKRAIMAVGSAGSALYGLENQDVATGAASTQYTAPISFAVGRREFGPSPLVLTNASINRVVVFSGQLSQSQCEAVLAATDPQPTVPLSEQIHPHWLAVIGEGESRKVPSVQLDLLNGRCWSNGRERPFSEVISNNNGALPFNLLSPPKRLRDSTGLTVITDLEPRRFYNGANRPSGNPFQASSAVAIPPGLQNRFEWSVSATGATAPGGLINMQAFSSANGSSFAVAANTNLPTNVGGGYTTRRGQGINRYGVSMPSSGNPLTLHDANPVATVAQSATFVAPDFFRFGALFDGTSALQNCDLRQVIIYSEALSQAEMEELGQFNEYGAPALFIEGDSLNNVCQPLEMLRLHASDAGFSYLPAMSCGLGGRGLSYHEDYIEAWVNAHDHLRDYLCVLNEGGFDTQSASFADPSVTEGPYSRRDVVGFVESIFSKFREPRHIYMEAHSNSGALAGTAYTNHPNYNFMQDIKDTWPEAWCPTNALMQSQATTDADYEAFRFDGRTPSALREDAIHINWGAAYSGSGSGYYWWSLALWNKLQELGWPGKAAHGD